MYLFVFYTIIFLLQKVVHYDLWGRFMVNGTVVTQSLHLGIGSWTWEMAYWLVTDIILYCGKPSYPLKIQLLPGHHHLIFKSTKKNRLKII